MNRSNYWRWGSLLFVWLSLVLFLVGCLYGGLSIMGTP